MTRQEAADGDSLAFWNEAWREHADTDAGPDELLVAETAGLTPGRALDLGCGVGGNAVWLARQGWKVTAVDFAETAIEQGKRLADWHRVHVDFVVADVAAYEPDGEFDLVTSFYIQLLPHQRAAMLAMTAHALAPGGTLLFASHDRSGPPEGWTDEDLTTLTTPEQVTAELPGVRVEKAVVVDSTEVTAHTFDADEAGDGHVSHGNHAAGDSVKAPSFRNTIVRAVRP